MNGFTNTSIPTRELEVSFTNICDVRKNAESGTEATNAEGKYPIE